MTTLKDAQEFTRTMDRLVQIKQTIDYKYRKNLLTMDEYRRQSNLAMAAINEHNGRPIYKLYPEE